MNGRKDCGYMYVFLIFITLCKYWQLILHSRSLDFLEILCVIISYENFYHLLFGIAVSEVHGRTFGVWTLLTCTLCYLCAFNLDNKPLYTATFLSFIYAFGHFLSEYLVYQTMAIGNLATVGIFAGNSHCNYKFGKKLITCDTIKS